MEGEGVLAGSRSEERRTRKRKARGELGSVVRPVSEVAVELRGEEAFETARSEVLRWMSRRVGRPLPENAWEGQGFALEDVGALPAETVAVETDGLRLWAGRLDDADRHVPRRVWTTEIALGEGSGVKMLGMRLLCVSHGEDPEFERTVPGLVRQVVSTVDARLSGVPVRVEPSRVEHEDDVDGLVALLTSADREVDMVVFSIPDTLDGTEEIWESAGIAARKGLGAVHVAVLGPAASYGLSERVGREFSVFGGAVRTYRPGFDPDEDDPFAHPLALARTVHDAEAVIGKPFHRLLIDQSLRRSVSRHDALQRLPSYRVIRQFADEERRKDERAAAQDDSELLDVVMKENEELRAQIKRSESEWEGRLEDLELDKEAAEEENGRLGFQNRNLRERLALLDSQRLGGVGEDDDVIPTSLAELGEWSLKNLSGSVEVVSRALKRAKKSVFGEPELVYKALLMLRDKYVPMKRGQASATRQSFDAACRELQMEEGPCISANRAGEEGDEYYVSYESQRRLMDRHLKKGNARDARRCLRIYFFWDAEREQVVVGSLPGHLDTRNT